MVLVEAFTIAPEQYFGLMSSSAASSAMVDRTLPWPSREIPEPPL